MNPLSLIKQGLLAAGRNFDRNAAGDLPTVMGTDFTPDARRRARSNAIMAIGQSLASGGQVPLGHALAQGQQQMLGGWQAAQQVKQDRAARATMAQLGADMQAAAGGSDNGVDGLYNRARQYEMVGAGLLQAGKEKSAEQYFSAASKLREIAEKRRPAASGAPVAGVDAQGNPVYYQPMTDGSGKSLPGVFPTPRTQVVNTGGEQRVIDLNKPGQVITNTQSPDSVAQLGQADRHFLRRLPIEQQNADSQRIGANASMIGARASAQNANTSAARLDFDKTSGAANKLGEAAVDNIAQVEQGLRQLDSLSQTIAEKGSWMGPVVGRLNGSFGGVEAGQAFGMNDGAVLLSQIALARQVIGKALEGGVLRKEDEAKYAKILPTMADSPAVAQQKIAQIKYELASDLKIYADTQRANGRRVAPTPDVSRPGTETRPRIIIGPPIK